MNGEQDGPDRMAEVKPSTPWRRWKPSRRFTIAVGVPVVLLAVIVAVNQQADHRDADADSTSAKGPATDTAAGGYAHSRTGARQAAEDYAELTGSDEMYVKKSRDRLLQQVMTAEAAERFQMGLDRAYTPELYEESGLHRDGSAPKGFTFVDRTFPINSSVTAYRGTAATVAVWCLGTLGLDGHNSPKPLTTSWYTVITDLTWTGGTWKMTDKSMKDGPEPAAR
ncbi:hypothetical protein [Streptomyces sp. NPDC053560]|uniref:hypothetical protein n=1 Tax=Streptomyces sp. NPDC053560 TaxID=3365711 RepID=UPI0037CDAEF4